MKKSAEAFRTISEVSALLGTPAHVLRFWESRFSQVKPVKRAGGRRYYRPGDLALLGGIKKLLHQDGLTIRGVQKILREQGVRHVASLIHIDLNDAPDEVKKAPAPKASPKNAAPQGDNADGAWPPTPTPDAAQPQGGLLPDPDDIKRMPPVPAANQAPFPGPAPRSALSPGAERREALGRGTAAPEAPMQVDAPTLPKAEPDNVRSFAPASDDTDTAKSDNPDEPPASQPAATMLRAMDTLRARDKKSELMSVYLRLVDLRERLARNTPSSRD